MNAVGAQLSTVPKARVAGSALAFCPLGDTVLAIEARRIEAVWDPGSEPWRMEPEYGVDLASHFKLRVATQEAERRRVDITIAGQFVTFLIDQQLIIDGTPQATFDLPEVVSALTRSGVRSVVPWHSRYAYLIDVDRIFELAFPEGG